MIAMHSASLSTSRSPTPETSQWIREPPSSCSVMSWFVIALTSAGPPSAIELLPATIGTKSASPGMYAVPAAPGPTIAATCGTTPLITVCSRNRWPLAANSETSSGLFGRGSMRAPAESISHTIGIRQRSASSRIRVTLVSLVKPIDPPFTVKSYAAAAT